MGEWSAVLFTAVGLAIGWLFNQISAWWQERGQRQRIYRRMLFFLLRVEWLHERMDVSEWVDHYIDRLRELKVGGDSISAEVETLLRNQITPKLASVAMRRTREELAEIEAGYIQAMEELSHIAPFLAYRLEGRTGIIKRLEAAQDVLGQLLDPLVSESSKEFGILQDAMSEMRPGLLEEDLEEVRELMRAIAIRIGPLTWLRTVRGYRPRGVLSQDEKDHLNEFIDELIEHLRKRVPEL